MSQTNGETSGDASVKSAISKALDLFQCIRIIFTSFRARVVLERQPEVGRSSKSEAFGSSKQASPSGPANRMHAVLSGNQQLSEMRGKLQACAEPSWRPELIIDRRPKDPRRSSKRRDGGTQIHTLPMGFTFHGRSCRKFVQVIPNSSARTAVHGTLQMGSSTCRTGVSQLPNSGKELENHERECMAVHACGMRNGTLGWKGPTSG